MRRFIRAAAFTAALLASVPALAGTLVVRVSGVKAAQGTIYVGVCAKSFDEADCPYKDRKAAAIGTVELRIPNVAPGRYAIAVYHDVNGNGRLDKTLFVPNEPYGFSNDAGRSGIPSFEGALITVADPSTAVAVALR